MTETHWLTTNDPNQLVYNTKTSGRKLRLFAVACCKQVWDKLDEKGRDTVRLVEMYADRQVNKKQLTLARREIVAAEKPGQFSVNRSQKYRKIWVC